MKYPQSLIFSLIICLLSNITLGQIALPKHYPQGYPRIQDDTLRNPTSKLKVEVDTYVNRHQSDSSWIVSRLQMYWKTKSTEVFIKGGVYDHAEGTAPVPTVRFPGARDNTTIFGAPKLEDIQPYMDDARGVLLVNRSKPEQPLEWADISKTGRTLEAINTNIMRIAASASTLYRRTGEEKYARLAFDLFDTYMTGMYYRKEPHDLSNGHHQTITGLSTFEVIQETAMLINLTKIYDNIFNYVSKKTPKKLTIYSDTFRKWADLQIKNGVAYNNWDLIQAKNILEIAFILDENKGYNDAKGSQYYLNQVLNVDSERQWSIAKVLKLGYDENTGIWNESPGYSAGVLHDFVGFVDWFDKRYNYDILPELPVIEKVVLAEAQYLFPNGYTTAFGDSHYHAVSLEAAERMVENAKKYNKPANVKAYSAFIQALNRHKTMAGLHHNNDSKETTLSNADISTFATPIFSAPSVSYFAQRNGMNPKNGLMVAMAGSKGNHMHSNGISMEIYGKGIVLGPESGIGTSYFQQDYAEYYSQFPAHNTVAVDGISAYPVMKSNHGFDVLSSYPASNQKDGYFSAITFGELYFLEPESQSDQNRLTSIIRTSDSTAYYVDIFRSKKQKGGDKMHDYFYHNLGQELVLSSTKGAPLTLTETPKLSFAGGHLFAYDYFWNKKSVVTSEDFNATFKLKVKDREDVLMNVWMKGSPNREIFSVKAPPAKTFRGNVMIPDSISALSMPTLVVRQSGEAWSQPFVAVYESSTSKSPRSIKSIESFNPNNAPADFVGLTIESNTGAKELVFSNATGKAVTHGNIKTEAVYAVVSTKSEGLKYMFLGKGKQISYQTYSIKAKELTMAVLEKKGSQLFFSADKPVELSLPESIGKGNISLTQQGKTLRIQGQKGVENGKKVIIFQMPSCNYSEIVIK
ncbi:alginate lyase family protein [Arcicella aquatica]|uniref:Alginate lyase family protein n=1 Tax=Arcicella aquatica TaxID=217141 RepID=A0ABU5QNA7_9BACT|nr:hypothetical protein [Arcicella aquatica]MEA5257916.1 alginate lyase family protein [Arcicella aquatica]